MSKQWYPIIDESKCNHCGACIRKCTNGVYDPLSKTPVVVYPEGCIEGCHGCQSRCRQGAIRYFGEESFAASSCGCADEKTNQSASAGEHLVELFYLDDTVCTRCESTKQRLEAALADLSVVLAEMNMVLRYQPVHVDSLAKAEKHHLVASPTIRIDGVDLMGQVAESNCPECGELCGADMTCRDWVEDGQTASTPTKAQLMRQILKSLFSDVKSISAPDYVMPESIRKFFSNQKA